MDLSVLLCTALMLINTAQIIAYYRETKERSDEYKFDSLQVFVTPCIGAGRKE